MKQQPAATVTITISATNDEGKPLCGISKTISVDDVRHASHPALVELSAVAAAEVEAVISRHYG